MCVLEFARAYTALPSNSAEASHVEIGQRDSSSPAPVQDDIHTQTSSVQQFPLSAFPISVFFSWFEGTIHSLTKCPHIVAISIAASIVRDSVYCYVLYYFAWS